MVNYGKSTMDDIVIDVFPIISRYGGFHKWFTMENQPCNSPHDGNNNVDECRLFELNGVPHLHVIRNSQRAFPERNPTRRSKSAGLMWHT